MAVDPALQPPNPIPDDGTLAEGVERFPQRAPVQPTASPIEHEQSWGEWLSSGWDKTGQAYDAGRALGRNDRSDFSEIAIRDGYKPILDQLGLDDTQNPLAFGDRAGVKGEVAMRSSELLRRQGKDWLSSMADRDTQELEIVREIQRRRAKDPNFMPGVPTDVAGLHKYFIEGEKKKRAGANQVLERNGGAGVVAGNLAGGLVESLHDPVNILTLPIGGGGKTITQVLVRETLVNGLLEAAQLPFVKQNREAVGEHLSLGEAAADVTTAGVAGGLLEGALHAGGKAIVAGAKATGAIRVRNNPDLASSTAYKIFGALPEHVQKKYGPGVVTKWGKRLADGDALDDVFADLSNDELAAVHRTIVGDENITPEEKAGLAHLERSSEISSSSPYEADPTSTARHEEDLGRALEDVIADTPREEKRPLPPVGSDVEAQPSTPARPPAATSTASRRPLPAAHGPLRVPSWIYEGLKARGIDDHIAKGAAAGSAAEALGGDPRALNPTSGAFGIGQWLGGRKAELMRRYNGRPTPDQQLDFLAWELKGGDAGGKAVLSAKNEVEALDAYIRKFMRPAAGKETTGDLDRGMKALGRGGDALPAPEDGGAASIEFAEDPEIARLRSDALKLDDAVIGSSSSSVPPMLARQFRPDDLTVDAARFQFKAGGDDHGVTDRLRGIKEWNPMYAGRVVTWEDAGGRVFLADGHQRLGLARRLEAEGHPPIGVDALVLREADGVTADDARVYGALKNIAEGTGSMVDAAKVIRGAGDHLLAHLPPKSALVRDARALSSLSDEAFGAVYNDVLPADYAAVIGHLLPDRPEAHAAMVDLLVKTDPANRGQAESIVRQGIAAGMHKSEQVELFGTREITSSLMLERAKVLEKVLANLRKSKLVFKTAAKEADTLEAVGSKIAKSASEKEAQANAQALEIVSRLAFSHGPIADALNDAARKLAAGAKLGDVADDAARAIRGTDLGALAGTAAIDDANRLVPDGAGRGGDASEADAPVRAQPDEQPSLIDLTRATERFSDPDGPAVKQQAASLEHDFKMDAAEVAAHERERNSLHTVALAGLIDGGDGGELGGFHWRREQDAEGEFIRVWRDGEEAFDLVADAPFLLDSGLKQALSGNLDPKLEADLVRIVQGGKKIARREQIKAASKALEGGKAGEFRTVEPFPDEPGYHRFRYVADDGTAVGGNYTVDGGPPPFIEGFNVGDTNNPVKLGPKQVRKLFAEIQRQHPEATRVHAFRMTGARAEAQEMWIDLAGKGAGMKPETVEVHAGEPVEADAPALDRGAQVDPAIAERQRQETELKAAAPMQSLQEQLGTMGLNLFDHSDQPTFRLSDEGEEISAKDLLDELAADETAINALKGCL